MAETPVRAPGRKKSIRLRSDAEADSRPSCLRTGLEAIALKSFGSTPVEEMMEEISSAGRDLFPDELRGFKDPEVYMEDEMLSIRKGPPRRFNFS